MVFLKNTLKDIHILTFKILPQAAPALITVVRFYSYANTVDLFTREPRQRSLKTTTRPIEAGIIFDDNTGTTDANAAQLNNLGVGAFDLLIGE